MGAGAGIPSMELVVARLAFATSSTAARTSPSIAPSTMSRPGFAIPAFSRAMATSVGPSRSVWSRAMRVIAAARGVGITLVASSRPPRPTSTTARSTRASWKARNAASVATSKNESSGVASSARVRNDASASSPIGAPPTWMRSANRQRCGDV